MLWDHNLAALFLKSGFTRWPLLACSIIGCALIAERGVYFLRLRFDYNRFRRELMGHLRRHQSAEAVQLCRRYPNPVAGLVGIYLANINNVFRERVLSREGTFAMEQIEGRLKGLATITHVAPLLGLLGTVTGLVAAFHQIELAAGQVQPQNLAGGIWEALLSTVFGLIVAIPCMIAHHGFESVADGWARRMQAIVSELDEFFGERSRTDIKTPARTDTDGSVQIPS